MRAVPHSPDGLQPGDELHDLVGGDEAVRRSVYQLVKSLGNLKAGKNERKERLIRFRQQWKVIEFIMAAGVSHYSLVIFPVLLYSRQDESSRSKSGKVGSPNLAQLHPMSGLKREMRLG